VVEHLQRSGQNTGMVGRWPQPTLRPGGGPMWARDRNLGTDVAIGRRQRHHLLVAICAANRRHRASAAAAMANIRQNLFSPSSTTPPAFPTGSRRAFPFNRLAAEPDDRTGAVHGLQALFGG